MRKLPFVTLSQVQGIIDRYPTPFHLYDEAGIRASARNVNRAFSWNAGFREYYAVKACPNPFILKILREEGCGVDCASVPELMLARAAGFTAGRSTIWKRITPSRWTTVRLPARSAIIPII